jgi:hypothetical protein
VACPTARADEATEGGEGDERDEDEARSGRRSVVEELTYEEHPGLPPAASKIPFTDRL